MFQHGELAASQDLATELAEEYRAVSPEWSAQFRLLEAESAAWRGRSQEVLQILSVGIPASADSDLSIRRLSLLSAADIHLHRYPDAERYLARADALCSSADREVCSHVLNAHWAFSSEQGQYDKAFGFSTRALAVARRFHEPFDEAAAMMNLADTSLHRENFDEAIDWLDASNRIAGPLNAQDILLNNIGNLGWAFYSLGERDRALELFQDAEQRAVALGDTDDTIYWLTTSGYAFQGMHAWLRARDSYQEAFSLARKINSGQEVIDSLEDLANVAIGGGNINDADQYLKQLDPLITAGGNRLDRLDVTLARGRIAAARRQDREAEALFRQVESDPASQITMRLGAEHEMARLYEAEGHFDDAKAMYAIALTTFESARAQIQNENSKLPYLENATPIYDDSIRLLVTQGKVEEALAAADQSRARTLEQGLGLDSGPGVVRPAGFHPEKIAARADATLLFYWLGERQSWLWAITARKTTVFSLPPAAEITRLVERYRRALQGPEDPLSPPNQDGVALYRALIAPAKDLLPADGNIVILCDGALSELNFATLLVPGSSPHYWIEDANIVSAPSLLMLASAKPAPSGNRKLLLIGNAVSPGPDYPVLSNAGMEMEKIRRHFPAQDETLLEGQRATPRAYVKAGPGRYAYIDFVAHGVASRSDPLDSAIILSRTAGDEDSFRLHARDIMQHPIDARLVTIAACYGGGTRAYAGEGLVGLSWAFLYAGAHNVIGALWEVSDASTPLLMDAVYQGLQEGLAPGAALRRAQLLLLRSGGRFRRPFYWAPFQLYTGS